MKQILLIILAIVYALWPYDLLADLLPGWGWLDDALILYLAWRMFRRLQQQAGRSPSGSGTGNGSERENRQTDGPKDPYTVLGVSRDASPEEIGRAYRRLAAQYHPDKVQHLGEEFRQLAEERFKEIQEAYQKIQKRE